MGFPQYEHVKDGTFLMPIDDTFVVEGRGWVAIGLVARGKVLGGDLIEIVGGQKENVSVTASGVNLRGHGFGSKERPYTGDYVSIMIRGKKPDHVRQGVVLAAPGTMKACTKITADMYLIPNSLGGRDNPCATGYQPRLFLYDRPFHATIELPSNITNAKPGDQIRMSIELDEPAAVEEGTQFILKERHRIVGIGLVSELVD